MASPLHLKCSICLSQWSLMTSYSQMSVHCTIRLMFVLWFELCLLLLKPKLWVMWWHIKLSTLHGAVGERWFPLYILLNKRVGLWTIGCFPKHTKCPLASWLVVLAWSNLVWFDSCCRNIMDTAAIKLSLFVIVLMGFWQTSRQGQAKVTCSISVSCS